MIIDRYKGRPWNPPVYDCFELIRDFFKDNRIHEIPPYAKPDHWWEDGTLDLYMDNFEREGFQVVDEPVSEWRPGDVILMAVGTKVACHGAILLPDNTILHHFIDRISCAEPYRPLYRNMTVGTLRHPNCPDYREEGKVTLDEIRRRSAVGVPD